MAAPLVSMTLGGINLLDPVALHDAVTRDGGDVSKFWGRANSYRAQRGRHPGIGWVLVCKSDLAFFPTPLQPMWDLVVTDSFRRSIHFC